MINDATIPEYNHNEVLIKILKNCYLWYRFAYLQPGQMVTTNHTSTNDYWT